MTFDTTPAADEFSTGVLVGDGNTFSDATTLQPAVDALNAANVVRMLPTSATVNPSTFSGGMRRNTTLNVLQSRPTTDGTNAAGVMVGHFQNNTGGSLSSFDVSYNFNMYDAAVGQLPGFRVFYSPDGMPNSWTVIPGLSDSEVIGVHSATITPASPIANGGLFFILWVDDNAINITDPSYTIDNFTITLANQPPAISQQPASTTVNEGQVATLSIAASGSGITYQWYRGNPGSPTLIPGATASTLRVTNIMGGAKYAWSNPMDSGTYFVRITGISVLDSDVVTVTVNADTTPPAFSYALCGPGTSPEQMTLILSEPLNNSGGEVTDASNWEIKTLDNSSTLVVSSIGYTDDGASRTVTFDLDPMFPRDPSKGYKITLTASVLDTAKTANSLNGPVSVPVLCFTNEVVALTASWKYNDDDVDPTDQLPTTWKDVGYVDTAAPWTTGAGPFDAKRNGVGTPPFQGDINNCRPETYYNLGNVGTCINLQSPVTGTNLIASYYRTHFTFSGSTAGAVLHLNGKFDDSGIVYLNGTEVWRVGLAAGAVTHTTFSARTVGDGDAQDELILVTPASLVSGDNVVAVELHQQSLTSSDLTMGLRVSRLVAEPAVTGPTLTITYASGNVTVTSSGAGTLISSTDVAQPRAAWTVVGPIGAGAPGVTLPASGAQKFFSVRVP